VTVLPVMKKKFVFETGVVLVHYLKRSSPAPLIMLVFDSVTPVTQHLGGSMSRTGEKNIIIDGSIIREEFEDHHRRWSSADGHNDTTNPKPRHTSLTPKIVPPD